MPNRRSAITTMAALGPLFWARVDKSKRPTGCWHWTGKPAANGYGQVQCRGIRQKPMLTHRIAWELATGPIPDGLHVLHKCDNRICVRPSHLFLGTQLDNNADRHRKGRTASGDRNGARTKRAANPFVRRGGSGLRGEVHPQARLSDDRIALLRQFWAAGVYATKAEGARAFGISQTHFGRIIAGRLRKVRAADAAAPDSSAEDDPCARRPSPRPSPPARRPARPAARPTT